MGYTLLHFANLRLGTGFTALGLHGREQRAQLLTTLATLADLACVERVQAVLISGDLFDCVVPAPTSLAAVRSFFAKLRQAGIAVIVLPGARDPEGVFDPILGPEDGVQSQGALVLGPRQPGVRVGDQGLVVRALPLPAGGELPTVVPRSEPGALTIGLAYKPTETTIDMAALGQTYGNTGIRYLGLGGDPTYWERTLGEIVICSPGVPEPLEWGQERGSVALIRVGDDQSLRVERMRTGARSFARRELVVTPENSRAIRVHISKLARVDLALEVVLTGTCPSDVLIDPGAIEAELAPQFFHLRVVDRTQLMTPAPGAAAWPQGTVIGNYARIMDARIRDAADEEQAAFDREAYQIGMSLLQGGSARA